MANTIDAFLEDDGLISYFHGLPASQVNLSKTRHNSCFSSSMKRGVALSNDNSKKVFVKIGTKNGDSINEKHSLFIRVNTSV